jgi:hypothetical protein
MDVESLGGTLLQVLMVGRVNDQLVQHTSTGQSD